MTDRNDFNHPDYEPAEYADVESRLRRALQEDAQQVRPGDRLHGILGAAHEAGTVTSTAPHRRRLLPVAAAAAVAVIAGGVWWSQTGDTPGPTPATSGPTVTGPATTPPTSPIPTGSSTSGPSLPASTVNLPVYFLGPIGDAKGTARLFREFLPAKLPAQASYADRAKAALTLALDAQPFSNTDGYLQPWSGESITSVEYAPEVIRVDLATPGNPSAVVGAENTRLAVQQLVWTAQAAIGKGNIPVRFTVQGQPARLFGSISTEQDFTRPAASESWRDLAPIWVTAPARDATLPAGSPVVAKGEATVFEANVSWELRKDTMALRSGTAMASIGAPERGSYSIPLGRLSPGRYTLRVWEVSAKDGAVSAEDTVTFSVE